MHIHNASLCLSLSLSLATTNVWILVPSSAMPAEAAALLGAMGHPSSGGLGTSGNVRSGKVSPTKGQFVASPELCDMYNNYT